MITRDLGRRPEDADDVWANVAEVAAEVEAELDVLVRNAEDRVVARIQAAQQEGGDPPVELQRRRADLAERIAHWETADTT